MSAVRELTAELIRRPSITPGDAGCQDLIADRLDRAGFVIEHMPFGDVSNLWARRGNAGPLLCFAGHTDVVPPGPLDRWSSDPFVPELRDGSLYGRGAADMKGSLAAMLIATEDFVHANPDHEVSLAFLITSDEEGVAVDGTRRVMQELDARGEHIDYCIVGEPSSMHTLGDTLRVGRRGSLHGDLHVRGVQGHVAYPKQADNPIHRAAPALWRLSSERWDDGNEQFPATSLQISNLHAGTGADNVIPGTLDALFNFRYSTAVTQDELRRRVHALLDEFELDYDLQWRVGGEPFLTANGRLIDIVSTVLREQTGLTPELSTGGGTSDGRFIAPYGTQVVELGPVNASIHKIDEHVSVAELDRLTAIFTAILERFG